MLIEITHIEGIISQVIEEYDDLSFFEVHCYYNMYKAKSHLF